MPPSPLPSRPNVFTCSHPWRLHTALGVFTGTRGQCALCRLEVSTSRAQPPLEVPWRTLRDLDEHLQPCTEPILADFHSSNSTPLGRGGGGVGGGGGDDGGGDGVCMRMLEVHVPCSYSFAARCAHDHTRPPDADADGYAWRVVRQSASHIGELGPIVVSVVVARVPCAPPSNKHGAEDEASVVAGFGRTFGPPTVKATMMTRGAGGAEMMTRGAGGAARLGSNALVPRTLGDIGDGLASPRLGGPSTSALVPEGARAPEDDDGELSPRRKLSEGIVLSSAEIHELRDMASRAQEERRVD